tara:strand:+ start:43961 stop:45121 length:1161 start_codon:yes stop_codon:yes gene_type:complete
MLSLALICIGIILYTYFGYFFLVVLLSKFIKREVKKGDYTPKVALVIAAYNEEKSIIKKIENSLALNYPADLLNIYVVSDASSDHTDELVESYNNPRVKLIRIEGRVGKTEARNRALKRISEKIIVFSDATTDYDKDSISQLVKNFSDPNVSMVSGQLRYKIPQGSKIGIGQKLFWAYESMIKEAQTNIGTLTGSLGCMTAFRRVDYIDLPANIIEDFTEPLMMIQNGKRIVYEPNAICFESTTEKSKQEWQMRIRVIRGGMTGLLYAKSVLNPFKHFAASFQLISHKVLRWFVPVFAIIAFVTSTLSLIQTQSLSSAIIFILQVIFYLIVAMAYWAERKNIKIPLIGIVQYLFIVNLASLVAIFKVMTTKLEATWETDRNSEQAI